LFSNSNAIKAHPPKLFINQNKKHGPINNELIFPLEKLSKMLYFFRQAKNILTPRAKKFHSHLVFRIQVWSCKHESNLNPLFIKQKAAKRILNDSKDNTHTEPIFKMLGILPLPLLCQFFKVQFIHSRFSTKF
jgi:hypothetical protein